MTNTDVTQQTPKQIDAQLADLYHAYQVASSHLASAVNEVHRAAKDRREDTGGWTSPRVWKMTQEEAFSKAQAIADDDQAHAWDRKDAQEALSDFDTYQAQVDRVNLEIAVLDEEYRRRGGWTRAFIVTKGHVHSSMSCSTCYPTTEFGWLPELSGDDEDEIVGKAGERACTICYPSAPVDVLKRASVLFSEEEKQAQAEREAREAAKAEKAAKAAANAPTASGEPLEVRIGSVRESFKTERAALNYLHREQQYTFWYGERDEDETQAILVVLEAVADKRGVSVQELAQEIETKVRKKFKREGSTVSHDRGLI